MNVTVKSFANIKDALGGSEIEAELQEGSTVAGLISEITKKFPSFDRQIRDQTTGVIAPFLILINDQTFRSITDMETPLQDGDVVTIMIPFDGG